MTALPMPPPLLTFNPDQEGILVDLDTLVTTKLLIQANSGSGKSWMLRYLLEQTHGRIQQFVFDPEGEYASLRERFPYVLVGAEGDVPAHPDTAALLCRRLVELGASAILDLYDLEVEERARFIKNFVDALMSLPRSLWRPLLIVIDEAQVYCPEKGAGTAISRQSVISLCTRGRKRGYCAVLATQRISELNNNAAAELNNKLIGRTGLDADMARAGNVLGFDKERRQALPKLSAGVFYAFGPAISHEVVQIRSGSVETTHPQPGKVTPPAPPAPEQIQHVLAQLADLPAQAEQETRELHDARQRIADLEQQLRSRPVVQPQIHEVFVPVPVITNEQRAELQDAVTALHRTPSLFIDTVHTIADQIVTVAQTMQRMLDGVAQLPLPQDVPSVPCSVPPTAPNYIASPPRHNDTESQHTENGAAAPNNADGLNASPTTSDPLPESADARASSVSLAERRILTVLHYHPHGCNRTELALRTLYAVNGGGFRNALSALRSKGWITGSDHFETTPVGAAAWTQWEPLPVGAALADAWMQQVRGKAERLILHALLTHRMPMTRHAIAAATGYEATGGGFRNALSYLRRQEIIGKGDPVSLHPVLLEV